MRQFGRVITWAAGLLVLWAPLVTLSILSVDYLLKCLNALSDPGTGLVYYMEGRSGIVTLRAQSYRFGLLTGILAAQDVSISSPDGEVAARASALSLQLPDYLGGDPGALVAHVENLEGTLVRDEEGRFTILDLLPPETEEPSELSYRIAIENAVFHLVDRAGPEAWAKTLRVPSAKVDGIGDHWRGSGQIIQEDGGQATVALRSEPGAQIDIQGRFQQFDVSPWLGPLGRFEATRDYDLLRDVSAQRLEVSGPLFIRIPADGPARIDGTAIATGRSVRWRDLFAASLHVEGVFDNTQMRGWVEASKPGARARFAGQLAWEPEVLVRGNVTATLSNASQIPARFRGDVPAELSFANAAYQGLVAYSDRTGLLLHGSGEAKAAAWTDFRIESPAFELSLDSQKISVRSFRGLYEDVPIGGAGDLMLESETISAFASTGPVRIEAFREQTGIENLTGVTTLEARATGTLAKPDVELRAQGLATAHIEEGSPSELGPFQVLARYRNDSLLLDRIALYGPAGLATASGTYDLQTRQLNLDAYASGIDLFRLHSNLSGTAAGIFEIRGTPESFRANGPVEVYGFEIEGQSVPLLAAEVTITPERLVADEVRASRGAARLRGNAQWVFDSNAISGTLSAESIQLHDFLAEGFEGSLDLTAGTIGGTLDKPIVEGTLAGKDLVLQGVLIDSFAGTVELDDGLLELVSATFTADGGVLQAEGSYHLDTRSGSIRGTADQLPITRVQPLLPPETGIEGMLAGSFSASLEDGRVTSVAADGNVTGLSVNRAFLGSGFFSLASRDSLWTGSLEVGQPERFVQVNEFTYRQGEDVLDADVIAYGMPLRDLYFASRPYFTAEPGEAAPRVEVPEGVRHLLDRLQGSLDLDLHISGPTSNPNLRFDSLMLRNTSVDGEPTGDVKAAGSRVEELWTISELEWTGGPGILDVDGTIREGGAIALDGSLNNFDTQWLQRFIPAFSSISGTGNLIFIVTGQSESPQIEASLDGSFFEDPAAMRRIAQLPEAERPAALEKAREQQLKLEIYPLLVSQGSITAQGQFRFRGFTGSIAANVPFRYPLEIPKAENLEVRVHVPERPLDELKDFMPTLDVERTEGALWADISLTGTIESTTLKGGLNLRAFSLAFEDMDTAFANVLGTANLAGQEVVLDLSADSARGGSILADAKLTLPDIGDAIRTDAAELLLASEVAGSIAFNKAKIVERDFPVDPLGESFVSAELVADGTVQVRGPLASPLIRTEQPLAFTALKGDIPSVILVGAAAGEPLVSPRFELSYLVGTRDEPAELHAAASVLNLYGQGTLSGPMDDLEAAADLRVRSGHIRLPNARIALQDGGTVTLDYDGGGLDPYLRLLVDIEGRTAISTLRFGTVIERYDVFLNLRGNLLDPDEQIISARSDPPDLSQEQIMNLLGQVELVESISSNLIGGQQRRQLEQALAGLALPYVFDPFTEEIARQLGLEYLSLDYGPLGQTNITAAKWLGRGFMIQGRREISTPLDRIPDYDVRLTYRPPRRFRQLRNFQFSIGFDQDRPWKLSVEYGGFLPVTGTRNPSERIYIGEPPKEQPKPSPPR